MKAFKFIVKETTDIPSRPGWSVTGCGALVLAETEAEARALLRRRNIENASLPWDEVAPVVEIDMTKAQVAILFET